MGIRYRSLSVCFMQWDCTFFIQILLVELSIELLRIATIHTPEAISNAMGLIAALLLGQFAIDLGFFSEEILLFCAVGAIAVSYTHLDVYKRQHIAWGSIEARQRCVDEVYDNILAFLNGINRNIVNL